MNGIPKARFLKHKNVFHSNRDEKDTAFTIGLTLYNSWAVAPVSHSTVTNNAEAAAWIQQFHILLSKLTKAVMPCCMSEEYINFCELHKMTFNVPCFGDNFDTQAFFTSSQINCSTEITHVRGTAGGIHSDLQDCSASYSMSINLSVIRDSSNLGYFWFSNLCYSPIMHRPYYVIASLRHYCGTTMTTLQPNYSRL